MSSILSTVVGAINTNEDQISIQINCNPDSVSLDGSSVFSSVFQSVTIPSNANNAIPLSGGAVINIRPDNNKDYTFKKSDTKSYDAKVQTIKDKIIAENLKSDTSVAKDVSFAGYKQLADLRIALNKTFYEISKFLGSTQNFYEKDGVPEFILSTVYSSSTKQELQNNYNANKTKNIRDENLSPFLYFQFIPFETVLEIFSILSVTEVNPNDSSIKTGPGTFLGNLNTDFLSIYSKLKELNDNPTNFSQKEIDNIVSAAVLEIFPLYRIGEEVIIAELDDKLQLGGFYTFFKSTFYVKTPDLSGRDSAEYYSNFISKNNDGISESLFYVLEVLIKGDASYEYCPIVLAHNQLPSLTLKDGEMSYPDFSNNQSDYQIIYTGLDSVYLTGAKVNGLNKFSSSIRYFLSPLIKSENANNNIISQNGSKSLDKSLEINYSQPIEIATIPIDKKFILFTNTGTDAEKTATSFSRLYLLAKYGTIPLFESGTNSYGVSSADTFLSSINRPEIIVSDREVQKINDNRELLFYSTQQDHTRYVMSGNMPRFLLDVKRKDNNEIDFSQDFSIPTDFSSVVPVHWIGLTPIFSTEDSKDLILEISSNGKEKLKKYFEIEDFTSSSNTEKYFDISNTANKICFAVYAIDDVTGQFVRLPGPNINITLGESSITSINPNGYLGGNAVRTNDSISLEIIGENLGGTEAVYIIAGGTKDSLIASKTDAGFVASANSVKIDIAKKWSEITTNLGDFPIYLKVKGTKNKETNKDITIYISPDSATSATLPIKGVDKINFLSLNSIYYQPKGKLADIKESAVNTNGPDSIPLLFDGSSLNIRLGSIGNIFTSQNKNNIFTYFALKGDEGKKIVETFGLKEDVISIKINEDTYYSNKKIIWYFGDQNFSSSGLSNYAELSFPGPIESGAYNVRALIEGASKPKKCYFIFSNEIITSNSNISFSESNKYYPISILQIGTDEVDRPAFISAPHILGLIAKTDNQHDVISNFDISDISSSTKQNKTGIAYKIKKAIPARMIFESNLGNIKNQKISVKNTLDHLFILFNSPRKDKKYYKDCYQFFIGSKEITNNLSGKIKYLSNNIACAYFRGISSLELNGYSEIRIVVNDYEFGTSYNSDLYTKVSKTLTSSEYEILTSNDIKTIKIKDKTGRRIETYDSNIAQISTSLILPITNSEEFLKYQKYGYADINNSAISSSSSNAIYKSSTGGGSANDFYIKFLSPIKIEPVNLEITFGNLESVEGESEANSVFGAFLSDGIIKKETSSLEENVIIVNSNTLDVVQSRSKAAASAESAKTETQTKSKNVSDRNTAILENEKSTDAEKALAADSNQSLLDLNSATADLQSILDDVNSTAAQISAAVEQMNALMRKASALTDALSSANFSLSNLVDSTLDSNIGPSGRSTLINSLNQYYTYLPESFEYDVGFVSESTNKDIFIVVTTKIKQAHVIESKIPEIYSIIINNKEYLKDNFSDIKIGSSSLEILVKVKGGDRDSKFELGGYRTSSTFLKIDGEFYIYNVIIEPSIYTLSFSGGDCIKFGITNSNKERLRAERVLDPTAGQDVDKFFDKTKSLIDKQSKKVLDKITEEKGKLKLGPVVYDKAMAAKEALKSFCDMSFHLTAEVSMQLKFLKILYIPIKVIFCIIDVICALLHPVKLAFAVIRLFACLFDLILLLPQISMPVLFLTIALHILELLLCVIHKILGIVVAINEIVTALDVAIRRRDFESIKNLEITLNEHLLTIEADLQVLEPIIQILGLILELLQLQFAFPCQVTQDEDEPACIDPSMLAGLIVGKVAPKGTIVPDAMIPFTQDYTNLSVNRVGDNGNTPDTDEDELNIVDIDYQQPPEDPLGTPLSNILYKVTEAVANSTHIIVPDNSAYAGYVLPDLVDSQTNENKTVLSGGFFSGDQNGDGFIDNINYGKMRFSGGDFDASFSISCTKSKKRFSFGTATLDQKNDPRFVEFQFNSAGLTSSYAWSWAIGWLFRKKIIDDSFTLDSSPGFVGANGASLAVFNSESFNPELLNLVSPIDGFSDFMEYAGTDSNGNHTYRAKPLVADIEVFETDVDPVTGEPIVKSNTVTKTFGGIPCFAIVDEKFNVYFVEENGISVRLESVATSLTTSGTTVVPVIDNIFAKMINFPSAETQKFDREERQLLRSTAAYQEKGDIFKSDMTDALVAYCNPNSWNQGYKNTLGDAIVKMQANAGFLEGLTAEDLLLIKSINSNWVKTDEDPSMFGSNYPFTLIGKPADGIPYVVYINYRKLNDIVFLFDKDPIDALDGSSEDFVGVNGMQRLIDYLVDGLAALGTGDQFSTTFINPEDRYKNVPYKEVGVYDFANGNWAENDDFQYAINTIDVYNFPQLYFVDLRQVADDIAAACGASQTNELLLDLLGFTLDFGGDVVEPYLGCVTAFRDFFVGDDGIVSKIRAKLNAGEIPESIPIKDVRATYDALVDCTNKAIDDACKFVVNPLNTTFKLIEDTDETDLGEYTDPSTVVTEVVTDGAVSTMPTITGAMEYASGIGDSVTIKAGESATIQIIPRDSYDDEIVDSLDAREKIKITIVSDTTSTGATIEKVDTEQEFLWAKSGSVYTAKITSKTPGKVTIKASICDVIIQAVTDRGISAAVTTAGETSDCIPDVTSDTTSSEIFPPGALVKVDRILTVLFTASQFIDSTDDSGSGTPSINPQVSFTDMVN